MNSVLKAENATAWKTVVLNINPPTLHEIICDLEGENRELKRENKTLREMLAKREKQINSMTEAMIAVYRLLDLAHRMTA